MRTDATAAESLPMIYIVDSSVDVTGAFVCARNEALALSGIARVTLVLPTDSRIPDEELTGFAQVLRLPLVNLRRSVISFALYLPALLFSSWRLRRHMKADGAQRLQLNDFYLMHGAVSRLFGYRGRVVIWLRMDPRRFGGVLPALWLFLGGRTSDRVVAVSRFIQSVAPAGLRTELLYDTHAAGAVAQAERGAVIDARPRSLVFVGNYIEGKGQDDAVAAFARIAARIKDIELHFYGSDMGLPKNRAYRAQLEAKAQASGFSDRIRFHDFVRDPGTVLDQAYAALNFSQSESFSMTCLEAGVHGVPIVATRSGGPQEIVEDGVTGLLVPVGDVGAMAAAIATLCDDPARARDIGAAAARLVRQRFNSETFLTGLRHVLDVPVAAAGRPLDHARTKALYISYDGMLEPLGQSQVLRYLERLAQDHQIVLISFEKPQDWRDVPRREALRQQITSAGIRWLPLRYHKRPTALATSFDILQGVMVGAWAVMRYHLRIVHARSHVPSVMAIALRAMFGLKYVFDMRGFWPDERVDGGLWPAGGALYRVAKWFERRFLLAADRVVSLTEAAVHEMRTFSYLQGHMPQFDVITTCTDLDTFQSAPSVGDSVPTDRPFTLGYVGSVGVWYLFDETLRCFQLLRERVPTARLHILNRGGHEYIRERMAALNIDPESVQLEEADHAEVARAMQHMDAGIFFIKPVYSKMASAPTKLGEFLGCGVPCLGNTGVGDMSAILEQEKVGVALKDFDEASMRDAIDRLLQLIGTDGIKARCREVALRRFSLDDGARAYDRIYRELNAEDDAA